LSKLRDTTIENETILVSDKGDDAYTVLGPNLELRGCTIVMRISGRVLTLAAPRLIDCTVEAKRALHHVPWCNASIEDCRFSGTYVSNDFGHWPRFYDPAGGLDRADFSAATLNGSRFVNVDTEGVTFPPWPCFTILQPAENAAAFRAVDWPYAWGRLAKAYTDEAPEVTAVTALASYWVKKRGGTQDELRAILEPLDFVRL
jgi:hypothetical protein